MFRQLGQRRKPHSLIETTGSPIEGVGMGGTQGFHGQKAGAIRFRAHRKGPNQHPADALVVIIGKDANHMNINGR